MHNIINLGIYPTCNPVYFNKYNYKEKMCMTNQKRIKTLVILNASLNM